MRLATASIILAYVAALAIAAPVPADLTVVLDASNGDFNLAAFNANNIIIILQDFDVGGFNAQFSGAFDQNAIQLLIIQLGSNAFANSNLNLISDLSQFNVIDFANTFNAQFQTDWSADQILGLLVQLGLVDEQEIQNQLILIQILQSQQAQFAQLCI